MFDKPTFCGVSSFPASKGVFLFRKNVSQHFSKKSKKISLFYHNIFISLLFSSSHRI